MDSHLNTAYMYLDTITESQQNSWTVQVAVGSQTFTFKLDIGAEVPAISKSSFQTLKDVSLIISRSVGVSKAPPVV